MIRKHSRKSKATAGEGVRVYRRGLLQMAAHLGVSRTHLYFVVTGARRSPRIEHDAAFRAWKRSL